MNMDLERQQVRAALRARGADLELFEDVILDQLWNNWYRSARALEVATRAGLKDAGLPPGVVDYVLSLQGAWVRKFFPVLQARQLPSARGPRLACRRHA